MASGAVFKFNDKEWRKLIKKGIDEIKNGDNLLKTAYATVGFRNIIKHFKDEKGPRGSWRKRKDNKSHGLLKDTGKLRGGLLPQNVEKVNNKEILIFNAVDYSKQHNEGDKSKNLPQREFMWFDNKSMKTMAKIVMSKIFP